MSDRLLSSTNPRMMPSKLRMSGLPFMLSGWNGEYDLVEPSSLFGVYRREPHTKWYFFTIIGVSIHLFKGYWCLFRDCDNGAPTDIRKLGDDQDSPIGIWTYGARLEAAAE